MSNDDFRQGYDQGFLAGWNAAKEVSQLPSMPQSIPKDYKFVQGCEICGIGKNGEPLGVVCQHPLCPTRAYSGVINGGVALCDAPSTTISAVAGNVTFTTGYIQPANNTMISSDLNI